MSLPLPWSAVWINRPESNCAEYLFNVATSGKPFTIQVLNGLQACALDSVPDVHMYATAAYCIFMARQYIVPPMAHLNYLPKLYTFKRLLLDDQDFTKFVNPNILDALRRAIKHTAMTPQTLLTFILKCISVGNQGSDKACFTVEEILRHLRVFPILRMGTCLPGATLTALEKLSESGTYLSSNVIEFLSF